jgi:capsular exopolysaccharide synthesis family protein
MNEFLPDQFSQTDDQVSTENTLHIAEIIQTIFGRKFGILVCLLFSLFAAWIYYHSQTPEYHAVALMTIKTDNGSAYIVDDMMGKGGDRSGEQAAKDAELLKSMPIAEMMVRELWSSSKRDSLEFFGHRPYISSVGHLLDRAFRPKHLNTPVAGKDMTIQQKGREFDDMMRRYSLAINARIRVEISHETGLLKVSVASPYPDEAVFLTNTLCNLYKQADIQRNSEKSERSNRFVAEMLKDQQLKLSEADDALSRFMIENDIYDVSGNTGQLLGKMVDADSRYNDVMTEERIVRNDLDFIEQKLSDSDRALSVRIAQNVNTQLGAIQDELRACESEYIILLRSKNADDPEVRAKKQQLDVLKARYEQLSRSKIAGQIGYAGRSQKYSFDLISEKLQTERKLNQLGFSAGEYVNTKNYYDKQLHQLPEKQQQFVKLQRDRDVVSKTYLFLKEKLDETRILIGSEIGNISIIGSAFKPFVPEKPVMQTYMLVGLVFGIALAALYVLGAEYLDDTVKDEYFFSNIGLNVWGLIPYMPQFGGNSLSLFAKIKRVYFLFLKRLVSAQAFSRIIPRRVFDMSVSDELEKKDQVFPIVTDDLNSAFAESFRSIRTNLNYSQVDTPLKTVLVSGGSMAEGKSTICANLAMAWAISGKKTLIIDCDLRRPSQHRIFNLKRVFGLTDYLSCDDSCDDDRFLQKTHMSNLDMISAGTRVPNPNELLGSVKMHELIRKLHDRYDMIMIDSPPLFLSDAMQLAHLVDAILITARLRYSSKLPLKQYAIDHFLRPHILGVILVDYSRTVIGKYDYARYGYGKYRYRTQYLPYDTPDDEDA